MSIEKGNFSSPENSQEKRELAKEAHEQHERLKQDIERRAEKESNKHENLEKARHEIEKIASEKEKKAEQSPAPKESSPAERRGKMATGKERDAYYKKTLKEVQSQMGAGSRSFSKVIHNKAIEKTSEVAGGTVARPNALLSGAIFAFLLTTAVLLIARQFGYPLSGFESIGAFVLGWIIGLIYDYVRVLVSGKRGL